MAMRILKDIIKNDPKSGMSIEAFAALPEQTRNCVIGSLTTPLTKLFTEGIRQFMSNTIATPTSTWAAWMSRPRRTSPTA